ncbi:UNVERIFIED_CONTAM: hypothetical protein FKN15_020667 [Acipenser sinensis]
MGCVELGGQACLGDEGGEVRERVNNFPPLPKFIPLKPCFYQDFEEDIPAAHQQLVRRVYYLWICKCTPQGSQSSIPNQGCTGWEQHRWKYVTHSSGWIAAVMFFSSNIGSAVVMLVSAIMFTVVTVMMGVALFRVHRMYRGGGGSFHKAQEEWSSGAWKDERVREAGFHAVSGAGNTLPQYPTPVPSYPSDERWS